MVEKPQRGIPFGRTRPTLECDIKMYRYLVRGSSYENLNVPSDFIIGKKFFV